MVESGNTLIVGVSGGADSVCLLSVLCRLQQTFRFRLVCAHVNHMFRDTAKRDEEYVQALCKEYNIPCRVLRADIQEIAAKHKMSFEEAGRMVRYDFFEQLRQEYSACKIAVAHNLEDCSETMLFHLFRGTNLRGLGGMQPVNGAIIRPLLNVKRSDIVTYLTDNNIRWMEDETNSSVDYTRNRIRHNVIPEAEAISPGACVRMAETGEDLRLLEDYLTEQTEFAYGTCCEFRDGGTFIRVKNLERFHTAIQSRVLYLALEKEAGAAKDLGRIHVKELEKLITLQSGRRISLPYGLCAYRITDGILLHKEFETPVSTIALLSKSELEKGEEISFFLEGLGEVRAKLLFNYELKNIPQKTYTKWLDYDKITKCAVFRNRIEGDYLTIDDKGNRKRLKEYFIQEKIPAYNRDKVWVLADDNHIMWVPGYRISSFYKISEKTERVLELTVGGKDNE